jgi:serine phosphatase RsbU (regulator of sigma subunit)
MELPNGRLGLLIADVTDKGTGAALFMALSRTLIRTYAFENPEQPATALHAANKRILLDSRSSMFVTVFYGILDPASGTLTYCNAGHNPPYLLRDCAEPQPLRNTGIPLGIGHDATWKAETVALEPCDILVLYTDGVSEAQNGNEEQFEVERLLDAARSSRERTAEAVQVAILTAVDRFVGDAAQFDDLTVVVVVRDPQRD